MLLRLLGSLVYSLATLALFGAVVGAVFMPFISERIPWHLGALQGALMTLFFPGLIYVLYSIGAVLENRTEEFRRSLAFFRRAHDPLYWVKMLAAKFNSRKRA